MARWRLRNSHYLNILNPRTGRSTEWEYQETDQINGETDRKVFSVPKLLDTNDPKCFNYPGVIIVCQQSADGKKLGERDDIVFIGDPTPEMEPFDEDAEAISASMQSKWTHPIETLPVNGGMNGAESAFMEQMMAAFAKMSGGAIAPVSAGPSKEEFEAVKAQLAEMQAIMSNATPHSPIPKAAVARRA